MAISNPFWDYCNLSICRRNCGCFWENADRDPNGVETIRKVAQLCQEQPQNVWALRGNHEDISAEGKPLFAPCTLIEEVTAKLGNWNTYFVEELKPFLDSLWLCALIPGNTLLVHGGVSSKLEGLDDLRLPSDALHTDLLWSDPIVDGCGEKFNYTRGVGPEVSDEVCRALCVEHIFRSHQPSACCIQNIVTHGSRVVTMNATSVYGGRPLSTSLTHLRQYRIATEASKNDKEILSDICFICIATILRS